MNLAAVILAGGASTRMGRPKALLPLPGSGEAFIDRLIGVMGSQCAPVIVVLGHESVRIETGIARRAEATVVVNERYAEGQFSSLLAGLRAVPADAEGMMFLPVDLPSIRLETVASLAAAFERDHPLVAVPRYRSRNGHPVCCSRELIPEFLALPCGAQAREVIHRHKSATCYVDVDDPGILRDIDDPEAYRTLLEAAEPR